MTAPVKTRARRRDSIAAEEAFRARVAELGGRVVEPEWLGNKRPHRVICVAGHEVRPYPGAVRAGQGICARCAGITLPGDELPRFVAAVEAAGGRVLESVWFGAEAAHRVTCPAGHERPITPKGFYAGTRRLGGGFPCAACTGHCSEIAWEKFQARVTELGGRVLETQWLGANVPHRCVCREGHECSPMPVNARVWGICTVCSRRHPDTAWAEFKSRVAQVGGAVLEPVWLGALTPHRVLCRAGHESQARPSDVREGGGICRKCNNRLWNIFYVAINVELGRVKFGVTSNDARPRLRQHKDAGYGTVVRRLDDPNAHSLEVAVKAKLADSDYVPVQGREYFDIAVLPMILDVADHWEVAV